MKRKRGHKKRGKNKKQALQSPAMAAEASNNEVESGRDTDEENSEDGDGGGSVEDELKAKATTVATEKAVKEVEVIPPVVRPPTTNVYGRVKLKLKKPAVENKSIGSAEGRVQSDVGKSSEEVVDKKVGGGAGGGSVVDDDEKVGSSGKEECGGGGGEVVPSRGSSGEGGKEGGGGDGGSGSIGKDCGGVKVVLSMGSSGEGGNEGGGGSGKECGGVKVVYSRGLSGEGRNVGRVAKECGDDKVVSSKGSSGEIGKEGGGGSGQECEDVKVVLSRSLSGEGGKDGGGGGVMPEEEKKGEESWGKLVAQEGGKEVVDGSRKSGGIKIFSSRKSSQGGGKGKSGNDSGLSLEGKRIEESEVKPREGENDKQELVDNGRKSGGIKLVSLKNSSLSGGKESGGSGSGVSPEEKRTEEGEAKLRPQEADDNKQELVDSGRKSVGIKIVSSKISSPEVGKGSSGNGSGVLLQEKEKKTEVNYNKKEMEDRSKNSGGIKIVSLKSSSPVSGKESDGSGLLPQEKRIEENEAKCIKQELEDGSKKSGGIKIVSLIDSSPSGGEESGGHVLSQEEKKSDESEAKYNKQELEDGSRKTGGIKIVKSKNSSSLGAKESGGSGLSPKEKKLEENETKLLPRETKDNQQELEDISKNYGAIKIVSSRNSSPSGGKESGGSGLSSEQKKTVESEPKTLSIEAKYNKQELEASLEVLQKIMKMDAAEPFNVPVDPIKLGIPDYFDVIDTPMDFGTIRKNLESGTKYMDSEDVYKDVQYVWDNCYKYNNKGDYIVDLMKRVKKNFMKYWVAAGLYNDQSKNIKGEESSPLEEPTTSGQGKKLKKGKGVKRHKDDCLCAICIMKRRRREREAREAQEAREAGVQVASPHMKASKVGLSEEYKQEDNLRTESPVADTSSYMETSPYGYADAEMEDGEMRPEAISSRYNNEQRNEADRTELHDKSERSGDFSEKSIQSDRGDAELHSHIEARVQDDSGNRMRIDAQNPPVLRPEEQAAGYLQQRNELLELEKKRQKLRMLETFRDLENPMLLGLCGTLFPNNPQSVWSGGNSLVRCKRSCHRRDIHEAIASLVNPPCKSSSSLK